MTHTIEFGAGTHIAKAAQMLVDAAKVHDSAEGKFNDITLKADRDTTPESVVEYFDAESRRKGEAYRNSPAGKEAVRQADLRRDEMQATHDRLMSELPTLDWSSDVAVLGWLCAMQAPSDHVDVVLQREAIVLALEAHGFVSAENTGKDYQRDDRNNAFRYLVGQALSCLKTGPSIHPILHKFADEWRARFARQEHL